MHKILAFLGLENGKTRLASLNDDDSQTPCFDLLMQGKLKESWTPSQGRSRWKSGPDQTLLKAREAAEEFYESHAPRCQSVVDQNVVNERIVHRESHKETNPARSTRYWICYAMESTWSEEQVEPHLKALTKEEQKAIQNDPRMIKRHRISQGKPISNRL